MFKKTRLGLAVSAAFGVGLTGFAPHALAQAQPQPQQLDRVEVTGSLIKRLESETYQPVTTLKASDLEKAGVTNAEQALQFVTQNGATTTSTSSVGASVGGAAFANLRSLGDGRTLVLLDGKRVTNNPYNGGVAQSVDLNTIPLVAIDRIEVLADGASAIYGTDAIAGVVNFITRKEYQGFNIGANYQIPQQSGGKLYIVDASGGYGSLSKDGWNVFGGVTYRKQDPLAATERSFSSTAYMPQHGFDKTSPTTFPANYSQGNAIEATNPSAPNCPYPALYVPGNFGPFACGFDYVAYVNTIPEQEQLSALVKGSLAINKDTTAYVQYFWAKNTLDTSIAPMPLDGITMPTNSPYYPGGSAGTALPPAAAGTLDLTAPIDLRWRTTAGGPRAAEFENITQRVVVGVEGLVAGWDYQVAGYYSKADVKQDFTDGYVNADGMQAGLDGINGNFLNPFGPQTAAGQNYINSQKIIGQVQNATGSLTDFVGQASKEIYNLPAGPMTLAVGAEYRKEKADYVNNFALIRQAASSGLELTEDASGSQTVWAILGELAFPIVKNLDMTVALRYDDYNSFGGTWNPKIGVRYQPTQTVLLRGSYNTGFRAPNVYDLYAPNSITNTGNAYNDPVLCPGGVPDVAAGGIATRDCNLQFNIQGGGNTQLQPETSDAWTVGIVLQPTATITFSADYWNYYVHDQITSLNEATIFADPVKYADLFVRCSQVADPTRRSLIDACNISGGDPLAYIIGTQQNLGDIKTSGIDFAFTYQPPATEYGRFNFGIRSTYVLKYEYQREKNGEWINNLGRYSDGNPVFRYQQITSFGWQYGPWSALLTNQYRSGYEDANAEAGIDPAYFNEVSASSIWNLTGTWTGFKGLTLQLGVLNLLNADPKFSNQTAVFQTGYDDRYSNPLGRTWLLAARYEFK